MQSGPILTDPSSRGWFTRLRLPVALVQSFTPCDWHDFDSFIAEDDYFRHGLFKDRVLWLSERKIVHDIRYDTVDNGVDDQQPRVYRIFTAFANSSDAIGYKLRWM